MGSEQLGSDRMLFQLLVQFLVRNFDNCLSNLDQILVQTWTTVWFNFWTKFWAKFWAKVCLIFGPKFLPRMFCHALAVLFEPTLHLPTEFVFAFAVLISEAVVFSEEIHRTDLVQADERSDNSALFLFVSAHALLCYFIACTLVLSITSHRMHRICNQFPLKLLEVIGGTNRIQ